MDTQKTMAFLQELSEAAMTAARSGDTMLANRLGANQALQHYFNNVFAIQTMTPGVWAQSYPQYMQEADRIREAHDAEAQRDERMSAIEEQLAKLAEAVGALAEAQQPKAKRGKKLAETEVEAEPVADEEPEAEAEPDEDEPDVADDDTEQAEPIEDKDEAD